MRNLRCLAAVALVTAVVACSSDKTTAPAASVSDAFHIDSLYNVALLSGNHGDSTRATALSYLALVLGAGGKPTPMNVSAGGTVSVYQAAEAELVRVNTSGIPTDSVYLLVAWNDAQADEMILSVHDAASSSGSSANLILNDTVVVVPDSGQSNLRDTVITPASGKCQTADVGAAEAFFQFADLATALTLMPCSMTAVHSKFNWYFTPPAGHSTSYLIATHTFSAPRLVLPPS